MNVLFKLLIRAEAAVGLNDVFSDARIDEAIKLVLNTS